MFHKCAIFYISLLTDNIVHWHWLLTAIYEIFGAHSKGSKDDTLFKWVGNWLGIVTPSFSVPTAQCPLSKLIHVQIWKIWQITSPGSSFMKWGMLTMHWSATYSLYFHVVPYYILVYFQIYESILFQNTHQLHMYMDICKRIKF